MVEQAVMEPQSSILEGAAKTHRMHNSEKSLVTNCSDAVGEDRLSQLLESIQTPQWTAGYHSWKSEWWRASRQNGFYSVIAGTCVISYVSHRQLMTHELKVGDSVLVSGELPHVVGSQPADLSTLLRMTEDDDAAERERSSTDTNPDSRNGYLPTTTSLTFGTYSVSAMAALPSQNLLPGLAIIRKAQRDNLPGIENLLFILADQSRTRDSGIDAVVNAVGKAVYFALLRGVLLQRARLARGDEAGDRLNAFLDPFIGRALHVMHQKPGNAWSVQSLAEDARMSRSGFAARFRDLVGKPPLQYLTELRISKACELLEVSTCDVQEVSSSLGYESASAFSNVFKRFIGTTPGRYRQDQRRRVGNAGNAAGQ